MINVIIFRYVILVEFLQSQVTLLKELANVKFMCETLYVFCMYISNSFRDIHINIL